MIKYENNKGICRIEIEGDLAEMVADVQLLIWSLHKRLFEKDPETADIFKLIMKETIEDENTFNPDFGKKSEKQEKQKEDYFDMDVVIELAKILSRINKESEGDELK